LLIQASDTKQTGYRGMYFSKRTLLANLQLFMKRHYSINKYDEVVKSRHTDACINILCL